MIVIKNFGFASRISLQRKLLHETDAYLKIDCYFDALALLFFLACEYRTDRRTFHCESSLDVARDDE